MTTVYEDHTCETELPAPLYYASAHFTGAGVVKCRECDYLCASWECACDFPDHECDDHVFCETETEVSPCSCFAETN